MIPARTALLAAASLLAIGTLVSCAAEADPAATTTTVPTTDPSSPVPTPIASITEEPVATDDPTCETIIPASVVTEFTDVGWTARVDPLYIGSIEVIDGIQCTWGDYSVASDQVQIFGWGELSATDATTAQQDLLAAGWIREEGAQGVYITESPDTTIATDENGYGLTYLFGDGWVTLADTKQSLLLVEWPPA